MGDPWMEAVARARALTGPLDARLGVMREACRVLTPAYDAAVDAFVARLTQAEVGRDAPGIGDAFPDFMLPDQAGRLVRLEALRAQGPVVVALHRGAWCDFCQLSLAALAQAHPRLRRAGATLVAVAPQRAGHAARHLAGAAADFPMLADIGCGFATQLGLTALIDDDLRGHLAGFGIDLSDINGDDGRTLPIPATFLVSPDGRVAARHVDPDPRRRIDVDALLQALGAGPATA